MISHEIKKKLTKDNLFGIIIILNLISNKYIYIMKSSQHWKHRLRKKFGMGKQSSRAKKYKYPQIESTKKTNFNQAKVTNNE